MCCESHRTVHITMLQTLIMSASSAAVSTAIDRLLELETPEARQHFYARTPHAQLILEELKDEIVMQSCDTPRLGELAECAFELGEFIGTPTARALAHWSKGNALKSQGEYQTALACLEKAQTFYKEAGQTVEAHRVATSSLQALAMIGDLEGALKLAQTTSAGLRRHNLLHEAARVENNIGIIQARLGYYAAAIDTLIAARSGHKDAGDVLGVAYCEVNLADAYQNLDRFALALQHLSSAAELFEKTENSYMLSGTLVHLAMLHRREGRFSLALDTIARAKRHVSDVNNSADLAYVQLEEARIRLDMNLLTEAETLARDLVNTFGERDMHLERLEAQTLLGMTLSKARDTVAAALTLREARAGWQALGNDLQGAWAEVYLASLLIAQPDAPDAATAEAQELVTAARKVFELQDSPTGQALTLTLQAQLDYLAEDYVRAQEGLFRAESLALELGIPDLIIRTARLSGLINVKQGKLRAAETYFERAIRELESVRASLQVDEFKAAYFGEKLDVYQDICTLLIEQGRFESAFHFVERSKSRALLDLLNQGVSEAEAPTDPHLLGLIETLRAERKTLNQHYLRAEKEGVGGPAWVQVQATERRVSGLTQEIEQLRPASASTLSVEVPSSRQLISALNGNVLLEYYALENELIAFLVTENGVRCVRSLGQLSDVKQHLDRLEFTMMRVAQGELYEQIYGSDLLLLRTNAALKSLYDLLIRPLDLVEQGERLVIIPYGFLHAVPFSALFDGQSHLFEKALLSLAPSAAVYLHCQEQAQRGGDQLTAFGVPFEDIPAVREEIEAVTGTFKNAEVLMGSRATLAAFASSAPRAQILHIATHGVYRPDNPMFSGLRFYDGWLAARDLYSLKLNASLVVLSACETGVAKTHASDELFGLARGFFHAGTPCLIVSLWAVKDSPTSELMVAFYEGLQAGLSAARALQNAQKTVKTKHPNPYFWSAFNVLGDPERKLENSGRVHEALA